MVRSHPGSPQVFYFQPKSNCQPNLNQICQPISCIFVHKPLIYNALIYNLNTISKSNSATSINLVNRYVIILSSTRKFA